MKAEIIKERPDYELLKQNDVVNFYHLQFPRWLNDDGRYMRLSVEAKFSYMLLFNRFQLSRINGWINENGEVFIIYTRKELAKQLNAGEKRASAVMNELKEYELIWERRRGRGFANQIYLANVKISLEDALKSEGGPLNPHDTSTDTEDEDERGSASSRPAETAVLDDGPPEKENTLFSARDFNSRENGCFLTPVSKTASLEAPKREFKTRQNGGSGYAGMSVQEPPNLPPNYIDFRFIEHIHNQRQSMSSQYDPRARMDRLTDADVIETLVMQAELESLGESDATVIRDAIERLYFMQSIRIGNAIYPNERIRSNLWRINAFVAEDAVNKITKNAAQIRNSSAYVVTVLFNTIMESGSDLIVDPYLNFLRAKTETGVSGIGGG